MRGPLLARFMAKVSPEPNSGCWLWVGAHSRRLGYGTIRGGCSLVAHRVAWELFRGPIPGGLEPDHLCRNSACVNPGHLELVTHRENTRRSNSPMGLNARKTHCLRGHPLFGPNLYEQGGRRQCRECIRIRARLPIRNGLVAA